MQLTEMDYNAVLEPLTINTYILVITENIDIRGYVRVAQTNLTLLYSTICYTDEHTLSQALFRESGEYLHRE